MNRMALSINYWCCSTSCINGSVGRAWPVFLSLISTVNALGINGIFNFDNIVRMQNATNRYPDPIDRRVTLTASVDCEAQLYSQHTVWNIVD